MKIYRPVRSNRKTQSFGENIPCAKLDSNNQPIRPYKIISGRNTCPVGYTKFYPLLGLKGHNGEDWVASSGEDVYFSVDEPEAGGWYSKNSSDLDGGLGVDVISKKPFFNGNHLKFRFWHLEMGLEKEDVKFGELIGKADNTGASSGDHLHWSMKPCTGIGRAAYPNNGYYGAENFSEFFINEYVMDKTLSPSDKIAVTAATEQAKGNSKVASVLWFIVNWLKSFGK